MLKEYEILGIDKNASYEELKLAYRRAAMRWHPDRNPDDPQAKERFQEIEKAYRLLCKITPRAQREPNTADNTAAAEEHAQAQDLQAQYELERAVEAWRQAKKKEQEERKRHARRRAQYHQEHAEQIKKYRRPLSIGLSVFSLLAGAVTGTVLAYPLNLVALSAFIFFASVLYPADNKTYTGVVLTAVAGILTKLYFIGLLLWVLWQMLQQLLLYGF